MRKELRDGVQDDDYQPEIGPNTLAIDHDQGSMPPTAIELSWESTQLERLRLSRHKLAL